MVNLTTLTTLEELEREMAQTGRARETTALQEALVALARPDRGFLTTGRAAESLGVSIPTIERWIERGALSGGALSGRWVVSQESVDRRVQLRSSLTSMDQEGNPTADEVTALVQRTHEGTRERRARAYW